MMEISHIASRLGLPEERVAQIMQLVKMQGMDETQMASMMRMATGRGLTYDEIAETMYSLGMPLDSILRVLRSQDLADDAQCAQLRTRLDPASATQTQNLYEQNLYENTRANGKDTCRDASGSVNNAESTTINSTDTNAASADVRSDTQASVQDTCAAAKRKRYLEYAKKAGVILFWLCVWELLDHLVNNRLLLAGPTRTLQALAEQIVRPDFWLICGASFGRIALGFFLALIVGFGLATLCYRSQIARRFVDPIISLLKTIPMASFIILLLIWVGTQALTVYLAFLIVIPIIYTNTLTGFESANPHMLEMARVHKLSTWRTFVYIYRPAFMPFLYSSCKLSLGMSWKAGIMAEVLAVPFMSIGKEMYTARTFLDTPDLLAWTVVVMILSLIFEKAVLWGLARAQRPCGGFLGKSRESAVDTTLPNVALGVTSDKNQSASVSGASVSLNPAGLQLCTLNKAFGSNRVLVNTSLEIEPGGTCCLMAPSGSGKTTLFRVMLGLESADSGTISGVRLGSVSCVFQEDRLCETLTPIENVLLLLPRSTSRNSVRTFLEEILPCECLNQPVMELSGGMRRRVSLARAVAFPGTLLILDEPFTGLDVTTRKEVIEFIVRHKAQRTLLVATHGENDARLLGARRVNLAELNKEE